MKKRLRKKKRLGEFQELGFEAGFRFSSDLDKKTRIDLIDRFIENATEESDNNSPSFGAGG